MLTAFLAGSGREVIVPDAVAVVDGATADEVCFVDGEGKTLVIFKRADVAIFAENSPTLEAIKSAADMSNGSDHSPETSQA